MAERDPRPDPPSVVGTRHSHHLECPICLEQFRQPMLLPCLHCEEYLSFYIVKETSEESGTVASFTCPVCRKLSHPVDKSQEKENWAKQFPSDSHVGERIRIWQIPARPGSIDQEMRHAQIADRLLCEDHKYLGCSKCIHVDHRMCEDVSTAEECIRKLESKTLLQQKMESIQQGVGALEALIKDYYLHIQSVSDDKDAVLKSLDDLQEQINRRVEELKKEVTEELVSCKKNMRIGRTPLRSAKD
ncbi:tripartite motif-containing protein 3-like [Argopecten irradians]|uniref:tripartite motif-containing protein 3-like n=1 Tax=Argopecten irradians TaxID=31199 RepID=UPI00371A1F3F